MSVRDIKVFLNLLKNKMNLGLPVDHYIYEEFENKTRNYNFIFSSGNDFIYEFFNYDNFFMRPFSKKLLNYLNTNKLFNKMALKYADKGLAF